MTAKELADAKVRFRSSYYDQLESGFGKANLLASFALFRDDPNLINTSLQSFENVTAAQVKAVAAKYLVSSNRTIIDRVPEAKPATAEAKPQNFAVRKGGFPPRSAKDRG